MSYHISVETKFQNHLTKSGIFTNPRRKDVIIPVFLTPVHFTENVRQIEGNFFEGFCASLTWSLELNVAAAWTCLRCFLRCFQ